MALIEIDIDLTKIDKSRIKIKDGHKYYKMTLLESKNNKYKQDWMVVESITKEERESGKKGTILGNGKNVGSSSNQQRPSSFESGLTADPDLPY